MIFTISPAWPEVAVLLSPGAAVFLGVAWLIAAFVLRSQQEGATGEEVQRDKAAQAAACAQQVPGAIR